MNKTLCASCQFCQMVETKITGVIPICDYGNWPSVHKKWRCKFYKIKTHVKSKEGGGLL